MIGFVYAMRAAGIPVSIRYILELYRALERGLASNLDQLFLLARLIFVKRVEHYDLFEQVFAAFFLGTGAPTDDVRWAEALAGKPFEEWLRAQIERGLLPPDALRQFETEELLARFWETLLAQDGAHHGGSTWVGTRGRSPYGHSGQEAGGVRVFGQSRFRSAQKVIAERRYVNYSDRAPLATENLGQALRSLRSLQPAGAESELDVDATIARTARNGGEIELVFRRELRNRLNLIVMLDNGGYSMLPYLTLVKTVFNKIRDVVKDVRYFYFHNCIYGTVYRDPPREHAVKWEKLLAEDRSTRLILIGDANMAPAELMAAYGALDIHTTERKPGKEWLQELRGAFPVSVWLNPVRKDRWEEESSTIQSIQGIFPMEDLTLAGIKAAVEYLNIQGQGVDKTVKR